MNSADQELPANGTKEPRVAKDLRGPGAMLRQAREQRGMTQREAADRLNLACRFVVAMEDEAFDKIPSPVYTRGYLRNYAKLLAVPSDELIRRYENIVGDDSDPYFRDRASSRKGGTGDFVRAHPVLVVSALVLLGVLLLSLLIGWLVSSPTVGQVTRSVAQLPQLATTSEEPVPAVTGGESASTPNTLSDTSTSSESLAATSLPSEPAASSSDTTAAAPLAQPTADAPATAEATATPAMAATEGAFAAAPGVPVESLGDGPDVLAFSFSAQCWVEVSDFAGRRLISGMRGADSQLNVRGRGPFQVTVGNAAAANLAFNGRAVGLKGVARNNVASLRVGADGAAAE